MASSTENVAPLFELVAQLGMVENLASRCEDDLTILIRQRLPAAPNVYNAQSYMREAYLPPGIESEAVRSPVPDRGRHAP
jgi:hypothetical protein